MHDKRSGRKILSLRFHAVRSVVSESRDADDVRAHRAYTDRLRVQNKSTHST
jgi:hypothetical protein